MLTFTGKGQCNACLFFGLLIYSRQSKSLAVREACGQNIRTVQGDCFSLFIFHCHNRSVFVPGIKDYVPKIIYIQIKNKICRAEDNTFRVRINTSPGVHYRRIICHTHNITISVQGIEKTCGEYSICHGIFGVVIIFIPGIKIFFLGNSLSNRVNIRVIPSS